MSYEDCFVNFPVLETKRLILRQMTEADEADINELSADFDMRKYWGYYDEETGSDYPEFEDEDGVRKSYFEHILAEYKVKSELRFVIFLKSEQKVIGEVILYDLAMKRQGELGYRVNKNYWGKGIAKEAVGAVVKLAFEVMGLKRLSLRCFKVNTASQKVAEGLGFTREGLIRQGLVIKTFTDYYIYGYLAEEYLTGV